MYTVYFKRYHLPENGCKHEAKIFLCHHDHHVFRSYQEIVETVAKWNSSGVDCWQYAIIKIERLPV